jgi:hypothetical protein
MNMLHPSHLRYMRGRVNECFQHTSNIQHEDDDFDSQKSKGRHSYNGIA